MIRSTAFSKDGKILAIANGSGVDLWDITSQKLLRTLKGHDDDVYSIAFAPDGKRLASGGRDKTVKLWDIDTGQEVITLRDHNDYIYSVSFSSDGKTLISVSKDGKIKKRGS